MTRKAPKLACDIGNVMEIHQGQDQRIEHSEHLGDGGNTNAAPIFSQRHITTPVESIFNGIITNDKFCLSRMKHLPKMSARRGFPQEIQCPSEATKHIGCPKAEINEKTTGEYSTLYD